MTDIMSATPVSTSPVMAPAPAAAPVSGFAAFGLPKSMMRSLDAMGFTAPTPIQTQAIPMALAGDDIMGTAQTGTGKTGAFGIPLVAHLINNPDACALVLTPTRELAQQVLKQLRDMTGHNGMIRAAFLIGGDSMQKQIQQLRNEPRLIVGTPGRINDHLKRHTLDLSPTTFLVLDEADRMLDMGFGVQLASIAAELPKERQTLMFSATMPDNIIKLARSYLNNPKRVEVGSTIAAAPKIKQEVVRVDEAAKYDQLVEILQKREGSIIVFVKTKYGADRLATKLSRQKHNADAIHGDLRQNQRDRVIKAFRAQESRILVATDVAARGLDVPHIETVINYDLPQCPEDYIHRIGRTGRNGAEGTAICLLTNTDRAKWNAINRLMNPGEKTANDDGDDRQGRGQPRGGKRRSGPPPRRSGGGRNHRGQRPSGNRYAA